MEPDRQAILLFFVFLFLDLIVVLVQSSLLNARLPQLMNLKAGSPARVERAVTLMEKVRLRVALRILAMALHFLMAAALWVLLENWIDPQPGPSARPGLILLALAGGSILALLIEFGVEALVLKNPEGWALRVSPLARLLDWILIPLSAPLMVVLGASSDLERRAGAVTEDELKTWVEEGQEEGSLEKDERQMIYSIFQFGDTLVREIMIPRIDILALDVETRLPDAIQALVQSGHSRVPVYEETIDNIVGLLYAKDLLRVRQDGEEDGIRAFLRPAYFVPEAKKVDELLREMQSRSVHMAVVVDEYGGMAGLVTLEDIVEEIVGEIRDEYDQSEEVAYQILGEGEILFSGRADLDDVNDVLGTQLDNNLADTLGGYIYGMIGRVPAGGEEVQLENWTLKVEHITGRRIRKVRALRREPLPVEPPQEKPHDKR